MVVRIHRGQLELRNSRGRLMDSFLWSDMLRTFRWPRMAWGARLLGIFLTVGGVLDIAGTAVAAIDPGHCRSPVMTHEGAATSVAHASEPSALVCLTAP